MDFAGTVQESFCAWLDMASDRSDDLSADGAVPFRQIIDVLPQCIFWKDMAGRFIACNRAGAKALGLSHPDEIDGKTDADFHEDQEVANYLRIEDERVMHSGFPIYRHLSQGRGPAESAPWFETSKIPLRNEHGEIVGLLICYEDVTERMRMEELLRRANEQLAVAANFTHNWSMWVDAAGRLRWVSPAVESICGYSIAECFAMADYPLSIIHPIDRERVAPLFVYGGEGPAEAQFRFVRKDGQVRWGSVACRAVVGADGEGRGIRSSVVDITPQKEAEARLVEFTASLELRIDAAAAEAAAQERLLLQQSRHAGLGEMIGCIAHQWRQPLTALGLLLQNLQYDARDGALDPGLLDEKLGRAFRVVERMSTTIDDFRNFFKPASKDSVFDATGCVEDVLRLMAPSIEAAHIRVEVDAAESCLAAGRSNELSQVLLNLIGNARDALLASDVAERTVWIEVESCGDEIRIVERNNGGAIAADHIDRIFDPYYTTKTDGTGLGLHMSRLIVERHFGGSIACRNIADGVEFEILLPAAARPSGKPRRRTTQSMLAEAG